MSNDTDQPWGFGTAADVQQVLQFAVAIGQQLLADADNDSIFPQLFVLTQDADTAATRAHEVFTLAVPFSEDAEKRKVLTDIARDLFARETAPLAAALLAEAWLSKRPTGAPHLEPRHDPGRTEVLIVQASAVFGEHDLMVVLPVRRDEANHLVADGEVELAKKSTNNLLRRFFAAYLEEVKTLVEQLNAQRN